MQLPPVPAKTMERVNSFTDEQSEFTQTQTDMSELDASCFLNASFLENLEASQASVNFARLLGGPSLPVDLVLVRHGESEGTG